MRTALAAALVLALAGPAIAQIAGVRLDVSLSKENRRRYLTDAQESMFDTLAYQGASKDGGLHVYATLAPCKPYQAAGSRGQEPISNRDGTISIREPARGAVLRYAPLVSGSAFSVPFR